MARLPRVSIPGIPHHVTQRGNRRDVTFFEDGDFALYLDLLADAAQRAQAEVWSYCLMPNHVNIVIVPSDEDGLWRTFRRLHRDYTGFINARMRTTGHLCQGRYGSVAMDEAHLVTAFSYGDSVSYGDRCNNPQTLHNLRTIQISSRRPRHAMFLHLRDKARPFQPQ